MKIELDELLFVSKEMPIYLLEERSLDIRYSSSDEQDLKKFYNQFEVSSASETDTEGDEIKRKKFPYYHDINGFTRRTRKWPY